MTGNGKEQISYSARNQFPRVWVIRYKDGYIESAGTCKEEAARLAKENGKLHGGVEVIT